MSKLTHRSYLKARRKSRGRKRIAGTSERPRMSVFRSTRHVYAQVIDDVSGKTLASIHSYDLDSRANKDNCKKLGSELAKKCLELKIDSVVFDRNGNVYHGRVQAFAEGAREGGLKF